MIDFKGNLRRVPVVDSNINTPNKDIFTSSDFYHGQKNKYERSERSEIQAHNIKSVYNNEPSMRSGVRVIEKQMKEIYDNVIPMKIKSQEREDQQTMLRFTILKCVEKNNEIIIINATDDTNHLFLWTFYLKETDYQNLKNEQKIKVEFSGFPGMVIDHLEFLLNQKDPNVYFHGLFEIKKGGEATLNILEANKFKESLHLSLKFKMANDDQIKNHLSDKVTKEREDNQCLRIEISRLTESMTDRMHELTKANFRLKEYQDTFARREEEIMRAESKRYEDLHKESTDRQRELLNNRQREIRALKEAQHRELLNKQQKISILENKQEIQMGRIQKLQGQLNELSNKYATTSTSLSHYQKQYNQLVPKNQELERIKSENLILITDLKYQIENLQYQLKSKDQIIMSSKELTSNSTSQVQGLEKKFEELKRSMEKLEAKYEGACEELTKANVVIEDLQKKNNKKKDKLNNRKDIIEGQERRMHELQGIIDQCKDRQTAFRKERMDLERKINQLETQNKEYIKKIDDSAEQLRDSRDMINHLNKQLTERTGGMGYRPSTYTMTQPQTVMNRYPITTNPIVSEPSSFQPTAVSRLRMSTSPIDKTEKIQPLRKYIPQQSIMNTPQISPNIVNKMQQQTQLRDPEQINPNLMVPQMTSTKVRPIKYRAPVLE